MYSTCSYDRICDQYVLSTGDMNPISVGAILWGCHRKSRSLNIVAFFKRNMNLLCILDVQVLNHQVFAVVEGECLKPRYTIFSAFLVTLKAG